MLMDAGVLTDADASSFYAMCESWGLYHQSIWEIQHDENGKKRTMQQYRKERGYLRSKMPEVMDRKEAMEQFMKYSMQFGMTPASRNKIDLAPRHKEEISDTERILNEVNSD